MDESIENFFSRIKVLAFTITEQLHAEVLKLGFNPDEIAIMNPELAIYQLEKDPYNGLNSLVGTWLDSRKNKMGSLLFHAEGSFFVEYDIARIHPEKQQWFVEAVNAWGTANKIKAEARLIPMPE